MSSSGPISMPELIAAVKKESLEEVQRLLAVGADPNVFYLMKTPLYIAAECNLDEIVFVLLGHVHIDPNLTYIDFGTTPIHLAIKNNNLEMAKAFLAHPKFDFELNRDLLGHSLYEIALDFKATEIAEYIRKRVMRLPQLDQVPESAKDAILIRFSPRNAIVEDPFVSGENSTADIIISGYNRTF